MEELKNASEGLETNKAEDLEQEQLDDATFEPRSLVEQNDDYQQAENIQNAVTELADNIAENETNPESPRQEAIFEQPIETETSGEQAGVGTQPGDEFESLQPPGSMDGMLEDPLQPGDPQLPEGMQPGEKDVDMGSDLVGMDPSAGMLDSENQFGLDEDMFSNKGNSDGSPNPIVNPQGGLADDNANAPAGVDKVAWGKHQRELDMQAFEQGGKTTITDKHTGNTYSLGKNGYWHKQEQDKENPPPTSGNKSTADSSIDGGSEESVMSEEPDQKYDQDQISLTTEGESGEHQDGSLTPEAAEKIKDAQDAKGEVGTAKVETEKITDPPAPSEGTEKEALEGEG